MNPFPQVSEKGADVYFNLHSKVFSLKCRKEGKVFAHTRGIIGHLGASFVVQKAGRAAVLRNKVKNVHAFVRLDAGFQYLDLKPSGLEYEADVWSWHKLGQTIGDDSLVAYNPYKAGHFYRKVTETPMHETSYIVMTAPTGHKAEMWAI